MKEKLIWGFIALSALISFVATPIVILSVFFVSKYLDASNYESAGFWLLTGILGIAGVLRGCERILNYMNEK